MGAAPMNRCSLFRSTVCALSLLLAGTGCKNFLSTRGTGSHMDAPREREDKHIDTHRRDMIVEVVTDAQGNVADIRFQRSSGRDSVDAYVAESIRGGWPRQPSTRSVAAVSYSAQTGFTQPKILSSAPAL